MKRYTFLLPKARQLMFYKLAYLVKNVVYDVEAGSRSNYN